MRGRLLLAALVLAVAGAAGWSALRRPPRLTLADATSGRTRLSADEARALGELIQAAGLRPDQLCLAADDPDYRRQPGARALLREGRVIVLRVANTALEHMTAVAGLPDLEELDLSENRLVRITGLEQAARLRRLTLRGNRLDDLSGLAGCRGLVALDVVGNRLAGLQTLPELPALENIYLDENPLGSLAGIERAPGLQCLFATRCGLADLRGLGAPPRLIQVALTGNRLTRLDELGGLVTLQIVWAGNNLLEDASALARLPALRSADLRDNRLRAIPALPAGVEVNREGNPLESPPVPAERTPGDGRVETLPPRSGSMRGHSQRTSSFPGGSKCSGTIGTVTGTVALVLPTGGTGNTLELQVGRGLLRCFVRDPAGGYRFADASPDHAVEIHGSSIGSGSQASFLLQALEGSAEEVVYEVTGH